MRLFITTLSMSSVIAFGYALAGYAGYAFGHGRKDYIVIGIIAGVLTGSFALWLWKRWMPNFLEAPSEDRKEGEDGTTSSD